MSSPALQFVLAGDGQQRLVVKPTGRIRPDVASGDDGNWLEVTVEILSGQFSGEATCSIRTEDLDEFRSGLAGLTDDRSASVAFKTMENQLGISIEGDGSGGVTIGGHVADSIDGNRLEFRFLGEVGGLSAILQSIDEILDAYPVS